MIKVGDNITGRIRAMPHLEGGEEVSGIVKEIQRKNGSKVYLLDCGRWLYDFQIDEV